MVRRAGRGRAWRFFPAPSVVAYLSAVFCHPPEPSVGASQGSGPSSPEIQTGRLPADSLLCLSFPTMVGSFPRPRVKGQDPLRALLLADCPHHTCGLGNFWRGTQGLVRSVPSIS